MEKNENLYYIIEAYVNGERLYVYSKRIALHFPSMANKFQHRRSACRYVMNSEFANNYYRILKYDKSEDKIIY